MATLSTSPSAQPIESVTHDDAGRQIIVNTCNHTSFQSIIVIDSTHLGPAIGGCRFVEYPSLNDAIRDACHLASAMTHKAALHELSHGGGKGVIIKPQGSFDRNTWLSVFSESINRQKGRYITSLDSGTLPEDMDIIAKNTPYVLGHQYGKYIPLATATGVRLAMEAAAQSTLGFKTLRNLTVAIQGVGNVGFLLARQLHARGAKLLIADKDSYRIKTALKAFDAKVIHPDDIIHTPCDILSPCALGQVIDDASSIRCGMICGAANNQLSNIDIAPKLHKHDTLYIPDFLANAGGLIFVANMYARQTIETSMQAVNRIYERCHSILIESSKTKLSPLNCANKRVSDQLHQLA